MKHFIAGLLVGSTLLGTVWAANTLYRLEPFSEAMTDEEAITCIVAGGNGAILFDLELDGDSYTSVRTGNACITEVK